MTGVSSQSQLAEVPTDKLHLIDYIEVPGAYEASTWGREFHSLRTDEALGAGSAGPGKTWVLLGDVLPQVMVGEELVRRGEMARGECTAMAWHLRRRSTDLDVNIKRSRIIFRRLFGNKASFNENDGVWTFPSGYQLKFGHCKNDGDWIQYVGNEATHLAFDEVVEFTWEQYQQIGSRVRSAHPVFSKMLKTRSACNPAPGWVRDYFYEPSGHAGRKILKRKVYLDQDENDWEWVTRIYLPATIDDNPDKAFVRRYKKQLASRPPHIRDALLYGNWYVVVGAYFANHWRPDLHVIKPFRIPGDWPRFRSLDWGYKSHGCCLWWAVDPDGNLICEREYTFKLKDGEQVAKTIKEIEQALGLWGPRGSKLSGPADTNLWGDWGQTSGADTHAAKMAKVGVRWIKADKKSRQMNAERVLARLDSHHHGTTRPGLVFFDTCRKCIETIPTIPAEETDEGSLGIVPKKVPFDHWYDAVSYAAAYHAGTVARLQEKIAEKQKRHLDDDERYYEEQDRKKSTPAGRYRYPGLNY